MTTSARRNVQLCTLGRLDIENADATHRSRRALALLALAAVAKSAGIDRDRAVAFLWPDRDDERAANSFRQTLHLIRREFGDDAILYEGGRLKLNPTIWSVDLWELEHAAHTGDIQRVATLYTGDFLDGFYVAGLGEFQHWVDSERERIKRSVVEATKRLAERAASAGDHASAIRRWREVVSYDALSSNSALGLIRALVAAGDRTGALEFGRAYEALIRSELETEPDDEVTEHLTRLRHAPSEHRSPHLERSRDRSLVMLVQSPPAIFDRAANERERPREQMRGAFSAVSRIAAVVVSALLLIIFAAGARLWSVASLSHGTSPDIVAVLPFRVDDASDSAVSIAVASLVSTDLDGAGALRSIPMGAVTSAIHRRSRGTNAAVSPSDAARIAQEVGAGVVVLGDVVHRGNRLRIALSLHDTRAREGLGDQIVVEGDVDGLLELVDEAATRILAERYRSPATRLTRDAASSTHSLPAIKAYLRGEAAFRSGEYAGAADAFREATLADTGFALAYYRLTVVGNWCGRDATAEHAIERALRFSDHLDDHDRRLLAAYATWRNGHSAIAEPLYRAILDDYPDDAEAWFQLGEMLFHSNPLRGASATEARPAFERLLAIDAGNLEALVHLARIAALDGRIRDAAALEQRVIRVAKTPEAIDAAALRAFSLVDRPSVRHVTRDVERTNAGARGSGSALAVAIDLDDVLGTADFARALLDRSLSPMSRAFGFRLLAHAMLGQGHWNDSRVHLDSAMALEPGPAVKQLSLSATLPFVSIGRDELIHLRDIVTTWKPSSPSDTSASNRNELDPQLRLHRIGLLSIRIGDLATARTAAAQLETDMASGRAVRLTNTLAKSLRAHIAAAEGLPAQALLDLDAADWEGAADTFAAEAADRYFRATLLEVVGRSREAARWYASMAQRAAYELPYLAPAQLRLAVIERSNGNDVAARAHEARAAELWRHADVGVRAAASMMPSLR